MQLDRRLWLTADKESVVEDGDPDAAFLLGGVGVTIPDEVAKRYKIKPSKATKAEKAEAEKAEKAEAEKAEKAEKAEAEKAEKPAKSGSGLTINKET